MRRPTASIAVAALLSISVGAGAFAAEPSPESSVPPTLEPITEVDPSLEPTPEPSPEPVPGADDPVPDEPAPAEEPVADEPEADAPEADPTADPAPKPESEPEPEPQTEPVPDGAPDPNGRYIVMLKSGVDTAGVVTKQQRRIGLKTIRTFDRAFRGFSARLSRDQRQDLLDDPNVVAVVPDEIITVAAQTVPNGIRRVGTRSSGVAKIDGIDERIDADVAIVDTGIGSHPDLNVVGGYNCSTSNRAAWRDREGHGTHVAGTVGALDNTFGVVGVAPGVRLWAVKILNDDGFGLLSWYVCGLDWILSQRDPGDPNRPMIEAVNMSVAKSGSDDGACGTKNSDILHAAICRLVGGGVTVVAAAANDRGSASKRVPAAYNEVITVSALADTDGKSGATGGRGCYSWGSYDSDDTFANFSNYGHDVDLIAPGKCIWSTTLGPSYGYSSGTSMAAPHVTGAAALYKSTRPNATPAEVKSALQYLGNLNWKTSTDPDSRHEKLLGVSRIEPFGTFSLPSNSGTVLGENGGTKSIPVALNRSSTHFERVRLRVSNVPSGWSATLGSTSLFGWSTNKTTLKVTVPDNVRNGTYNIRVTGTNWGRSDAVDVPIRIEGDRPTASTPKVKPLSASTVSVNGTTPTSLRMRMSWAAATDPSSKITAYEAQHQVDGGSWGGTKSLGSSARSVDWSGLSLTASHGFRIRARDQAGNWSDWKALGSDVRFTTVGDRSASIRYSGSFKRTSSASSTNGVRTTSPKAGATVRYRYAGRGIALIAPRSPNRGKVRVYIDGDYKTTIDTKASAYQARRIVYSTMSSASGTHTITLKVSGTSGRPHFSVDGFIVVK